MLKGGGVSLATLASRAFAGAPHDFYRRWRERGGVHKVSGADAWLLLDYDDVVTVARRSSSFSSSPNADFSPALHGADPPRHGQVRRLLQPFFALELQASRRPTVRAIVRRHIEKVTGLSQFDALADLAGPLTHALACDWLGLDPKLAERIASRPVRDVTWDDLEPAMDSGGLVARLRSSEGADRSTTAELAAFLLAAGVETVRELMLFNLLTLSGSPSFTALAGDEARLPSLADELLRLEPPVHTLQRRTCMDVTVSGHSIPAGSLVWASIAAANRDPAHFAEPDSIVLDRNSSRHISFGTGPHSCLGSQLGKLENEVILAEVIRFVPDLIERCGVPELVFSGPGGAPSLRQVRRWKISFPRSA